MAMAVSKTRYAYKYSLKKDSKSEDDGRFSLRTCDVHTTASRIEESVPEIKAATRKRQRNCQELGIGMVASPRSSKSGSLTDSPRAVESTRLEPALGAGTRTLCIRGIGIADIHSLSTMDDSVTRAGRD